MTPDQLAAKLPGLIAKNKRDAMSRAVLTVEAAAKRESPVKTGNLRRSITSRVERGGDRGIVGTNARYARAVHEGTRPRVIRPRRARALFWRGARHPVKSVRHPGTRANPFLERAMRVSKPAVERELAAWGGKVWSSVK
jgi:HK97 gp10 family phage protein